MRLRHRTVRAPRQGGGGRVAHQGASHFRGLQQKALGRPVRAARPPPGFAAAAAAWSSDSSDEEQLDEVSEDEEQGEDSADLLLQLNDTRTAQKQQQQQQQQAATPAPPACTQRPAPSSEARWLAAMALSPLLSLPRLSLEAEAAGAWTAPSSTPAALPATSPALVAGVERPAALPSPAFHDFGGPPLPPRQPLWGSQPALQATAAAAVAVAALPSSRVPVGAERCLARVGSDGSGRAGLAAATAAVAREATLFAAGGGATSPPMHPWDLRRPAGNGSPLQLHDVCQLQPPLAVAPPAEVPVLASTGNTQPYHLFACGTAVPFRIPRAQFGLPREPEPAPEEPAGGASQPPQPCHPAPPASEAAAVAAVEAAFAAAAPERSPRSAFTATHYSAGSSLAAHHTHAPRPGSLSGTKPAGRSQRSRRQRELSEEFHWSDEEEEVDEDGGSETETDEEGDGMVADSEDSGEESSACPSSRASRSGATPGTSSRGRSGRRQGGPGGSLQQDVQHAAVAKRIKQLLHLAAPEAAATMGLSTAKFRQLCRAVGIARWPSRRPQAASESDE